jgi:signal transduction histidine kinase
VKVTVKLAHEIQNILQRIIGNLELAKTAKDDRDRERLRGKAIEAALELSKLVKDQTVVDVETCEACGALKLQFRATLETKREKP